MKNVPYICGMKQKFAHIIIGLLWACNLAAQTTVTGTVTDGRAPLPAANVFIVGTIDGCLTDTLGRFSFKTTQTGEVTLKVTYTHRPCKHAEGYRCTPTGTCHSHQRGGGNSQHL